MPYIDFQQLEALDAETPATGSSTVELNWHSAARSHVGCDNDLNEDAFISASAQGLWAVADGMGGLARGDYASGSVVDQLFHFARSQSLAESIRELEIRLREAHDNCRNSFKGERVGSTVAALFSYHHYAFFLWAGDSRVYRLRDGALEQLTVDHTVAQERCDAGELSPAQAALHPSAHVLTRAVGVHQTLHLELDYTTVLPGDRYLLCSDGLYNPVCAEDIQSALQQDTAEDAVSALVDRALQREGQDNLTAIVLQASSS